MYPNNNTTDESVNNQEIIRPEFVQIPDIVAHDMRIGATGRFLYGYIYWLSKLKYGKCTASNATLGYLVGCSAQMIQKSLNQLEKQGYVTRIYTRSDKKIRLEIVPRVTYSKQVSPESDRVSPTSDTQVSPTVGTNKNRYNKNSKEYNTSEQSDDKLASKKKTYKENKFPNEWYDQVLDCYCKVKDIEPKGDEWTLLKRETKQMFLNERTPDEICRSIEYMKKAPFTWTLKTIRMKLPEILAKIKERSK